MESANKFICYVWLKGTPMESYKLSAYNRITQELAYDLAYNHVSLSVDRTRIIESHARILKNFNNKIMQKRLIVVLGAGSSFHAAGVPLAADSHRLLSDMSSRRVSHNVLEYELDRLSTVNRLQKDEFETILMALSKYDPRGVKDNLHTLFNRRFYPCVFYEVLAHMLKNRFIDVVINFNFDEILDQSIEDEMKEGEYFRIISDGDCPGNAREFLRDSKLMLPVYIKPHGTVSHKSSMRYTGDQYWVSVSN